MSNRRKSQIFISLALLSMAAGTLLRGASEFFSGIFYGLAIAGFIAALVLIRRAAEGGECPDNAFCRWKHRQLAKLKELLH